jgi:transcriptional regulator with XRE-family HTH domain
MSGVEAKIRPTVATRSEERAEPIGSRLKRLRLERGLSQRDLSSPGVSYAYISRIEAGARTPSVKALRMLAKKLAVSVEYLETGRDIRDEEERELRLADAELELRLGDDTAGAERNLEAILTEALEGGDVEAAIRARVALGLAAARRGNHLDAVERLEAATGAYPLRPHVRPDVYATLGQSYAALGAPDRAVRLFERCVADIEAEASDNTTAQIWFATLLSYALSDTGEYGRARDVIRDALRKAGDGVDANTRVRLYWSLARVAGLEGRSTEALSHIRQAIALLRTTDDEAHLARAYLLSAGVEALEGEAGAARGHLANARELLGARPQPIDLGMLRIGEARLAVLDGRGADAVAAARQALDLLGTFNPAEQGAAAWALARGLDIDGDVTGANDCYRRAVDLMSLHGRRHEAARAATDWARMLQRVGREDDAREALERAAGLGLDAESRSRG